MINRGAAVSAEDRRLVTPLHLAAEQVNPEMVAAAAGARAACAAQDAEGRTPRGFAERVGSADCARLLREAEARVTDRSLREAEARVAEAGVAEAGVAEAGRGSSRSSSHLGALSTEADGRMKENVSVRDLCALGGAWECKSEKLSTPGAGLAAATSACRLQRSIAALR
ncbi:hypothetical protein CLOM_g17430 [Closterium sp. NIES-68]|nr:hypothetical protein CLOM_g17430 [Closterium sp. NIES-68]